MNDHKLTRNRRSTLQQKAVTKSETTYLLSSIGDYFAKRKWKVSTAAKIRGKVVDLLAVKDDQLAVVEVKSNPRGLERGIEYALHQKQAVNLSYLALPKELISQSLMDTCRNLGLGLLRVNDDVAEIVAPASGKSMPSVHDAVSKKRREKKQIEISSVSSLDKLFRSKSLVSILKLLLLNSSEEFHLNEIARRTGISPSGTEKETRILHELGLIKRREQGNMVLFAIDRDSFIFDELQRIFLKFELLDDVIGRELPSSGIKFALVYGSFAKGKEQARSDIDLLIVGDVNEDDVLKSISGAERKIGREINYNLWSEEEFLKKAEGRIPLLKEILKTPVLMIVGDQAEFKRTIRQRSR